MATQSSNRLALVLIVMTFLAPSGSSALAQCLRYKAFSSNPGANDLYGHALSAAQDVWTVTALREDFLFQNSGAAYVLELTPPVQPPGNLLTPSPPVLYARSIAADDDLVVSGSDGPVSAFVFQRIDDSWPQIAQLQGSQSYWGDRFGWWVALDGDVIVVGAPDDTNENGYRAGAAYVFERESNGDWIETQKLIASDGVIGDDFGDRVAIDGDIMVVAAPSTDDLGFSSGSAYIFERDPKTQLWTEVVKLLPVFPSGGDIFGRSVAIHGTTVFVGAPEAENPHPLSGYTYIFERSVSRDSVVSWEMVQALKAPDAIGAERFGFSIAFDGERALIGARRDFGLGNLRTGAAYVFERDPGSGLWVQTAKLIAPDGAANDDFGNAVALSGTTAVVGARFNDEMGEDAGAVYLFDLDGGDCNGNGFCDDADIAIGRSADLNGNGIPDECECLGDLDFDGQVGLSDLSILLSNYGTAEGMHYTDGDLTGDGAVGLGDLSALLGVFGTACR